MKSNRALTVVAVIVVCLLSLTTSLVLSARTKSLSRNTSKVCLRYTSSDTIASLGGTFLGFTIRPLPKICPGPTGTCDLYITPVSCLGWNGPLGGYGPLASLGPLSHEIPSPNNSWEILRKFVQQLLGSDNSDAIRFFMINNVQNPLSAAGPLGDSYFTVMPTINDFTKHMQGLGVWSILGPIGPLGALGPLGPLGPMGIHNYQRNSDGDYIDANGKIQTTLNVKWDEKTSIQWPLFEDYTRDRAIQLGKQGKLDSSFMVSAVGSLTPDVYTITVTEPQYVTVLTAPSIYAKNFLMTVKEKKSKQIIAKTGSSVYFTPWLQFFVEPSSLANGPLQFEISVAVDPLDCGLASVFECFMEYYLYVVGSTKQMLRKPSIAYSGPYINKSC
ncbi:hypothetical protein C9374_005128 [Naegleria lovaniensis]|uniref:Uncharacterized protein n=1 Tax=Naegleria lovaniensis TaxID=51637 RepID=A0AA88KK45_NAELO|nr:uncharacterized protein C9374_005128 [Naegleria lovaniensis]KAG2382548.1 hypothetical protein C9374_005128 [Naegleria lovaniensis]